MDWVSAAVGLGGVGLAGLTLWLTYLDFVAAG
jgi:hypothetical protein